MTPRREPGALRRAGSIASEIGPNRIGLEVNIVIGVAGDDGRDGRSRRGFPTAEFALIHRRRSNRLVGRFRLHRIILDREGLLDFLVIADVRSTMRTSATRICRSRC